MKKMYSPKQFEIMDFVNKFYSLNGAYPTHRETRSFLQLKPCEIQCMLKKRTIVLVKRHLSNDITVVPTGLNLDYVLTLGEQRVVNTLSQRRKNYSEIIKECGKIKGSILQKMVTVGILESPRRGQYGLTDYGRQYVVGDKNANQ